MHLNSRVTTGLTLLASSILMACGGGSSGDDNKTTGTTPVSTAPSSSTPASSTGSTSKVQLQGKVIDGYVKGATVWLDLNNNGLQEDGEPHVVSTDAGNYVLELSESQQTCAQYATLIVDVPVGAYDEDLGEVTEAYQMIRPPIMSPITEDQLLNISPLTTVLWEGIKSELDGEKLGDCETLAAESQKREEIEERLNQAIYEVVRHYNIPSEKLFEDFIAANDEDTKNKAIEIVKGLKASFSYSKTLHETYPDADEIRVTHTRTQFTTEPNYWERETVVFLPNDEFINQIDKMSDDLSTQVRRTYQRKTFSQDWNSGQLETQIDANYDEANTRYRCSFSESVELVKDGVSYTLSNSGTEGQHAETADACEALFETAAQTQANERIYYFDYKSNNIYYHTDVRPEVQDSHLAAWTNLKDKQGTLDEQELLTTLSAFGYKFDEDVTIATRDWLKRKTQYINDTQVVINHTKDGSWERMTYYADGTHTQECGTDGVNWEACTN